ncbi:MAG: peptidylprolyl isomerase [Pseudomonadota bacterium]
MVQRLTILIMIIFLSACGGEKKPASGATASTQDATASDDAQTAPAIAPAPRTALEPSIETPLDDPSIADKPKAVISTSMGDITVVLYPEDAPKSVENFISYVEGRQYTRTIFHRVIPGFMIQGGGFSSFLEQRKTRDPIPYEGDNGLNNDRGTLAMARTQNPNSATAQWYINLEDNAFLNHGARRPDEPGYTVFGRVIAGMNIVDAISLVETSDQFAGNGQPLQNVPVDPVVIDKVQVLERGE